MLFLVGQYNIDPDDIAKVKCEVSALIPQQVMVYSQPKTVVEAKFSLEYCLAIACLDRAVSLRQFTKEKVSSSRTQEFMRKIEIIPVDGAPAITAAMDIPQKVTLILKNGKEYSYQVDIPKGDYRNPLSDEEVALKYRDCASFVLSAGKTNHSLRILQNLEKLRNVTELMDIIR